MKINVADVNFENHIHPLPGYLRGANLHRLDEWVKINVAETNFEMHTHPLPAHLKGANLHRWRPGDPSNKHTKNIQPTLMLARIAAGEGAGGCWLFFGIKHVFCQLCPFLLQILMNYFHY